jgi:hypothetical protein
LHDAAIREAVAPANIPKKVRLLYVGIGLFISVLSYGLIDKSPNNSFFRWYYIRTFYIKPMSGYHKALSFFHKEIFLCACFHSWHLPVASNPEGNKYTSNCQ